MQSQKLTILQKILQKYNLNYGNILHLCVHTRDLPSYTALKNEHLELDKHNNSTPLELAQKLNYTEFYSNDTRGNIIKSTFLQKYLNPIQGYETRKVVLTKDCLQSHSNKITSIDLDNCNAVKVDNKILIRANGRKYKFKGNQNDIDELYDLIVDPSKRMGLEDIVSYKDYYYVFLCRVLVDIIGDNELSEMVADLLPEQIENDLVGNSSDAEYDSCEEEFYDVNEQ